VGVRGELCIRGPIVVNKYYNNPQANEASWDKDGYFWTGDVAYFGPEEKGRPVYIVDRKKVWFSFRFVRRFDREEMLTGTGTYQSSRISSCACGT